jgi:Acetyl/propionyl-CoA carboxylase, alpha subunit
MNSKKIHKVLIANRGEIAIRIINTLRKLHINSVAVFADNDANALHRKMADEACSLGNGQLKDTYLNIQKIIDAALDIGAEAIHPGYGFLSESPEFAEACAANNLIFIGPDAESMRLMGNKIAARQFAIENGIPVTFGMTGSIDQIVEKADSLPYPIIIKAAAGGGGKGMHIVKQKDELKPELERASREAEKYFGDGSVFAEQYIEHPHHIEIQVLADNSGNIIHLYERECSIQRRYQKIIEESPSPTLTDKKRQELFDTAVKICRQIGYKNAGTIEFLVDDQLNFYFLEMNTRIQVEHPITEQRTGIDIVEEQIRIARGKEMGYTQESIVAQGHSIELRIYAENPENDFLPTPGTITAYHEPQFRGVRIDSSIDGPCTISESYDPMIAKLICHAKNRQSAIETAQRALKNYVIQGIITNKAYLAEILNNKDFADSNIDTSFCNIHHSDLIQAMIKSRMAINVNDVAASFLLFDLYKNQLENHSNNVWEKIGYWRYQMDFFVNVDKDSIPVFIKKTQNGKIEGTIKGKSFKVDFNQQIGNQIKIMLNGHTEIIYCSVDDDDKTLVNFHGLDFSCFRSDQLNDKLDYSHEEKVQSQTELISPMPGKVVKISVKEGDKVTPGLVMIVVEAMKMENNITATFHAKVKKINVLEGQMVDNKTQLIELEEI